MTFSFSINTPSGDLTFTLETGTSLLFVGANGGGKTRLAVKIEDFVGEQAHRVSAHRALNLDPSVPKVSERIARRDLKTGYASEDSNIDFRKGQRWGGRPESQLLNDYNALIQVLFAEQSNTSLESHKNSRAGNGILAQKTKFEQLTEIWELILPHRMLHISGDDIKVSISGADAQYSASDMSDGERAVFYLIGQTLTATENSLLIFDEPELHIHRSIMSRLWDELEAARPDCAMVFISHDLEFVASREGQKFVLKDYSPEAGWSIEEVPEDTGFSEELTTFILGSRKPILFVEGNGNSLDKAVYRACYPNWTIISRGSCQEVIHAVVTMRANENLTRVRCSGIVDADAYDEADRAYLRDRGIEILPVSEIENIFLLEPVARAIAISEGFEGDAVSAKLSPIYDELISYVSKADNQAPVIAQYCRRRVDRILKKIDLSDETDIKKISNFYVEQTSSVNINEIAGSIAQHLADAVAERDIDALLRWYDNKHAMMAIACKIKSTSKSNFEQWIIRTLRNNSAPGISEAISSILPRVAAA